MRTKEVLGVLAVLVVSVILAVLGLGFVVIGAMAFASSSIRNAVAGFGAVLFALGGVLLAFGVRRLLVLWRSKTRET